MAALDGDEVEGRDDAAFEQEDRAGVGRRVGRGDDPLGVLDDGRKVRQEAVVRGLERAQAHGQPDEVLRVDDGEDRAQLQLVGAVCRVGPAAAAARVGERDVPPHEVGLVGFLLLDQVGAREPVFAVRVLDSPDVLDEGLTFRDQRVQLLPSGGKCLERA